MIYTAQFIHTSIHRPPVQVYEYAVNPENLPHWAAGLSGSIKKVNGEWIAESPMGSVKVKFADKNTFGVLDHEVTLPDGTKVLNPMRVLPNSEGSELVFTLFRRPKMSDKEFASDAAMIKKDLEKIKSILEK
jgi:hypothetical protein